MESIPQEGRPYIQHDGREIFFQSNRSGSLSIWVSTRSSTSQLWSAPVVAISPADLGDATVTAVSTAALSWDARTLFLGVVRPSADLGDIYVSSREKLTGKQ